MLYHEDSQRKCECICEIFENHYEWSSGYSDELIANDVSCIFIENGSLNKEKIGQKTFQKFWNSYINIHKSINESQTLTFRIWF